MDTFSVQYDESLPIFLAYYVPGMWCMALWLLFGTLISISGSVKDAFDFSYLYGAIHTNMSRSTAGMLS